MREAPDQDSRHREARSALRTAEARSRLFFETSLAGIYTCTLECAFLECNEAFARILGYPSPAEILAINGRELYFSPADHDVLLDELRANTSLSNREARLKRRDGAAVWVIANISLVPEEEIGITVIKGSVVDITDRKITEEALRRSEERFRIVSQATNDAVWDRDLLRRTVWWSDGFRTLFGYHPEETPSGIESWTEHIHPDDRERVESGIDALIESGRQSWSDEYRFQRQDRTWARVLDRGYVIQDASGKPVRMIGSMMDVTERHRSAEIQAALYRIAEIASSAGDLESFYAELHRIVARLMYARNFFIALADEASREIRFPYFVDEFDPPPAPLPLGEGLTGRVLRTGRLLHLSGREIDELHASGELPSSGTTTFDWLGVPLRSGDRTFGVIAVQSYDAKIRYTEGEREILVFVSQHIAAALERKNAAEALANSERQYRSLFENANDCVMIVDPESQVILKANPRACELYGCPAGDLVGMSLSRFQRDVGAPRKRSARSSGRERSTTSARPTSPATAPRSSSSSTPRSSNSKAAPRC